MVKRTLWNVVLVMLVLWAPWWAALGWGIIGTILFPWYIEMIVAAAVYDAVYGIPGAWPLKHTVIFLAPFAVIQIIKPQLNLK